MKLSNCIRPSGKRRLALAMLLSGIAPLASASLVDNNLTGTVDYDGWDDFSGVSGAFPYGSFEAGSGDAELERISGGHFAATSSLYSFSTDSVLSVYDNTALAGVGTVVFSIETWLNEDTWATALPTLSYNGGSQSLAADLVGSQAGTADISFGGEELDTYVYTFQWDITNSGATAFNVDWGQKVHTGVIALQLEQSDTFSVSPAVSAVPVPAAAWLFGSALLGLAGVGRHRRCPA